MHYKDAIPHMPLKKMGFRHMYTEVYYEEESRLMVRVGVGVGVTVTWMLLRSGFCQQHSTTLRKCMRVLYLL